MLAGVACVVWSSKGDELGLLRQVQRLRRLSRCCRLDRLGGLGDPAMQQVGVQAVCQRYGRSGNSGLLAGRHDITLKFLAVAATTPTSTGNLNN